MSFETTYTPLPPQRAAPITVTVPDWFDLPSNDTHTLRRQRQFGDQVINVESFGGRPEPDVFLELDARVSRSTGVERERQSWETTALNTFDNPVDVGPVATDELTWRVRNRSGTDHTQAQGAPYQAYTAYTVRSLTVLDKLRRGIPLTKEEQSIMRKFGLRDRDLLNAPPTRDPIYEANLEEKTVRREDAVVDTVNVTNAGATNAETVADISVSDSEVVYVTGLTINGQSYGYQDDVQVQFTRDGVDDFYRLGAYGLPGYPFEVDLHLPFLSEAQVSVFAQNAVSNVDVRVEYATVERTLQEKALYGLRSEVRANDDQAQRRLDLYDKMVTRLRTGLPLEPLIESVTSPRQTAAESAPRR